MQVRPGRSSGTTDKANHLSPRNTLAIRTIVSAEMGVARSETISVVDNNQIAIST